MRETDFIEQNKEKWERYEASLKRSDQDPELLNQLYVHTTDDLSISRTFYPNRSVRVYLNGLAQRTFLHIYRGRRGEVSRFFSFWADELPLTVYASRRYLFTALAVFVMSMAIGILSYRIDPTFAETILGADYVAMTEANIASGDPMAVYKSMDRFDMSLHITLNNILVAFLTFIAGALACVGTLVALIRNGVMLGVFQYFFLASGDYEAAAPTTAAASWGSRTLSWLLTAGGEGMETVFSALIYMSSGNALFRESLLTIWIHGALEISSIVIAGGAGLTMGAGLLFPGTLTRLQSFSRSARAGLKIMLGTVPLFIVAGFLEGYVTRQTELPDGLRFVFILLCFVFIVWYYVIYPRSVVHDRPPSAPIDRDTQQHDKPYTFQAIRSFGELLSATFGILRFSVGGLLGGAALLALGYCLLSFGFGGDAARYTFVAHLFGDLQNFYELFASSGRGRPLIFTLLATLSFYGMYRLAFYVIQRRTDLSPPRFIAVRELRLLGVCALLALSIAFSEILSLLLVFLTLPFLLVLGVRSFLDYGENWTATFRIVYTNLGSSYGLTIVLTAVVVPLIWLLDTTLGAYFFTFFDWVIYTDASTIDARNVMLQTFCYFFLFTLLFVSWVVALTLALGSLREIQTAGGLNERIADVGKKRRLAGMERE